MAFVSSLRLTHSRPVWIISSLRRLMGQKSGLEDAYLKLSEEELLEGDSKHNGYVDVIDQLTIDDSKQTS